MAASILLLACLATAQSTDDVHIAPLVRSPNPSGTVAAGGNGELLLPLRPRPIRYDVDLVLVPVTVTDSYGRLVTGLAKQDFNLVQDGAPQQIRYFGNEEGPISLGVVLDVSRSMRDKIDDARDAVVQFFENANPNDDYFVISFSDYPTILADSTRSIGFIRERLATVRPDGYTALLDAIYLGVSKLQHARYARRALLVISDGGDNISHYTEGELKHIVEESDVVIYSVGIYSKGVPLLLCPEERHGKQLLTDISDVTGGRMIELHSPKELPDIARQVSLELRSQYVLGYRPSGPRNGSWRKIKVSLSPSAGDTHLQVYSKKGYLGPED